MILRPPHDDELGTVAELWRAGWMDGHRGHVPEELVAVRTPEDFHTRTLDGADRTTVAVIEQQIAGFIMLDGDELDQFYVAAARRGTGVADALMVEAERQLRAAGHVDAWLAVVDGNARAKRFYTRRGWADAGALEYWAKTASGEVAVPTRRFTKTLTDAAPPADDR